MSLDSWERNAIGRYSRFWTIIWNICDVGYYLSLVGGFLALVGIPLHWLSRCLRASELLQYPWIFHAVSVVGLIAVWLLCASGKRWVSDLARRRGWIKDEDYHDMSLFK